MTQEKRTYPGLFSSAITEVLAHEGGFVNNKYDPGGATNFGITIGVLKGLGKLYDQDNDGVITKTDVEKLTKDQAIEIYYSLYWKPIYEKLPVAIATKVFDMSVNMGASQAHKLLQRAVGVTDDGVFGMGTLGAVLNKARTDGVENTLAAIRAQHRLFYENLVKQKPSLGVFLKGWLRRAAS